MVWLLLGMGRKGYLKQQLALFFRTVRYDLLIYAAIGIALVIPFILLELPISRMSGGRDYYEFANDMIATLPGVIHVSADNWLLGQWLQSFDSLKGANHEIIRGFSVVLLGLFAAGLVRTVIRMRRKEEPESEDQGGMVFIRRGCRVGAAQCAALHPVERPGTVRMVPGLQTGARRKVNPGGRTDFPVPESADGGDHGLHLEQGNRQRDEEPVAAERLCDPGGCAAVCDQPEYDGRLCLVGQGQCGGTDSENLRSAEGL